MMDYLHIIVPAAGSGSRLGAPVAKQFLEIAGKPLLWHTLSRLYDWADTYGHPLRVMLALPEGAHKLNLDKRFNQFPHILTSTQGGQTRADSVFNALMAMVDEMPSLFEMDWVLVHDAARPMVAIEDLERLYQTVKTDAVGGLLAEKVTATVKKAKIMQQAAYVEKTVPRDDLWLAQTPQMFRAKWLLQALRTSARVQFSDEASAVEALGQRVRLVQSQAANIKITTAQDLQLYTAYLKTDYFHPSQ